MSPKLLSQLVAAFEEDVNAMANAGLCHWCGRFLSIGHAKGWVSTTSEGKRVRYPKCKVPQRQALLKRVLKALS